MATVQRRVRIRGRVQGVYFRADLRRLAEEYGLVGWVRNRFDGTVEAVVQGEEKLVDRLLTWCQTGPPGAGVSAVEVEPEPLQRLGFFSVLQTD
ncbi:MAG: acylphosphatase [Chloroflexi bacterium]|nr:acylphosphatase [Chloroflexota bacterium]